jgi:hypothetical protein
MLKRERQADEWATIPVKNVCAGLITLPVATEVLGGGPGLDYAMVLKLAVLVGLALWAAVSKVPCAVKMRVWFVLAVGLGYLVALAFVAGYLMNFVWIEVSSIAAVLACVVYAYQTLLSRDHRR